MNYIEISRTYTNEDKEKQVEDNIKFVLSYNQYQDKASCKKFLIKRRGLIVMSLFDVLNDIDDIYLRVELLRKVEKISNCERIVGRNGQEVIILHKCNDRGCPVCSHSRALKIRSLLKQIIKKNKKYRYSMLTLTVKDKDLNREKYQFYNKQVAKLIKKYQRKHKIYGSYRVQENKIRDGKYHLHYHILLASEYIKKNEISREWLKLTKDSFIVDIKEVNRTSEAVNEICKYITKIQDFEELENNKRSLIAFYKYIIDIKNLRTMQGTGLFYNLNETEIEKQITDEEEEECKQDKNVYFWDTLKQYEEAKKYYNFCLSWVNKNCKEQVKELRDIIYNELINLCDKKEYRELNDSKKKMYRVINFVVKDKRIDKLRLILPVDKLIKCYHKENEYHGLFVEKEKYITGYFLYN